MRTELPNKWCINREHHPEVQKWFTKLIDGNRNFSQKFLGWYTHYPSYGSNSYTGMIITNGYEEITFDEFKALVLEEKPKEQYYEIY